MKAYLKYLDPYTDQGGNIGQSVLSNALSWGSIGTTISPGWGSLIGGVLGAGYGLIEGESQRDQANRLLHNTQYPTEAVPQEVLDNQQRAVNAANEGTPSQQYQNSLKQINQNQATAYFRAKSLKSANADLPAIQATADTATGNLNAQSAMTRAQNNRALYGVNNTVAGWKDKVWQWNQQNRYRQNYNYGMSLLGAGNYNISQGVDKGASALTLFGASAPGQRIFNNLFSGGQDGETAMYTRNTLGALDYNADTSAALLSSNISG